MKWLVAILYALITAVLCIICYNSGASTAVLLTDTVEVVKWDTIVKIQPIVVKSEELGVKRYRVKRAEGLKGLKGLKGENGDKGLKGEKEANSTETAGATANAEGVVEAVEDDSVEVELPITQKLYEDSLYRAWVSGFDARLDSVQLYQPTRYITITTKEKPSRWSWGLQGGLGITPKGLQPYIGIGGQYKF